MVLFIPGEGPVIFSGEGQKVVEVEFLPEKYRYVPERHARATPEWQTPSLGQIEDQWKLRFWWNHLDHYGDKVPNAQ